MSRASQMLQTHDADSSASKFMTHVKVKLPLDYILIHNLIPYAPIPNLAHPYSLSVSPHALL